MANASFNMQGFYEAIDRVRRERRVTWNHIFRATGVTACHQPLQMRRHTLLSAGRQQLAAWAGIDARAFEQGSRPESEAQP